MSNRSLFISDNEPEDFDYFKEHFRVRGRIDTQTGSINGVALSRPFETVKEAEEALSEILISFPQAEIWREMAR